MTPVTRPLRGVAAVLVAALLLAACDRGGERALPAAPPGATAEAPATTEESPSTEGDDPGADAAPGLPDVATIHPDDVDPDAAPDTLDGVIASAAAALPEGWNATVVADPGLGPYVLGLPEAATVWRVGDDLSSLREAATDEAWWRYWQPILTDANEAADSSSLRAAAVLPSPTDDGAELHLTITATPQQDLPVDDPDAVAESFADTFRAQQLSVDGVGTERAGDLEVAALTLTTPEGEFDDGVPRRLHQWFYPEQGAPVLWSVTCEGPVPAADVVDEVCPVVLSSFRTPPR
jgi:hypothetical protein